MIRFVCTDGKEWVPKGERPEFVQSKVAVKQTFRLRVRVSKPGFGKTGAIATVKKLEPAPRSKPDPAVLKLKGAGSGADKRPIAPNSTKTTVASAKADPSRAAGPGRGTPWEGPKSALATRGDAGRGFHEPKWVSIEVQSFIIKRWQMVS